MAAISWSQRARADMVALAVYSDDQYGEPQRKKYIAQLRDHLNKVLTRPQIDRPYPGKPEGLFKTKFKANMVFYERNEENDMSIVRVLGSRMDFNRHL